MSDDVTQDGATPQAIETVNPTPEAYRELQQAYDHFNHELFEGKLPGCLFTLQREKNTQGYFSPKRFASRTGQMSDEIALIPTYFAMVPVVQTMQTLVHEMVHQWQAHFGKPGRGRYHNAEWADRMESVGLIPSSTGKADGQRTGDHMSAYPKEGGAFLDAAQKLITSEFKLSWFDRFLARDQVASLQKEQDASQTAYAVLEPGDSSPLPTPGNTAMNVAPMASVPAIRDAMVVMTAEAAAQNRSNRAKYTCRCGFKLWGRPGLRFVCEQCETRYACDTAPVAETGGAVRSGEGHSGGHAANDSVPPWEACAQVGKSGTPDTVLNAFAHAAAGQQDPVGNTAVTTP
jgi:predicted SprT family Zn-dependent metalloprotease